MIRFLKDGPPGPALAAAVAQVKALGGRPSLGSWEDEKQAYAFSVETLGPSTFGHPRYSATVRKEHVHAWAYYAGALGYESLKCSCGVDWHESPAGLAWAHEAAIAEDARRAAP